MPLWLPTPIFHMRGQQAEFHWSESSQYAVVSCLHKPVVCKFSISSSSLCWMKWMTQLFSWGVYIQQNGHLIRERHRWNSWVQLGHVSRTHGFHVHDAALHISAQRSTWPWHCQNPQKRFNTVKSIGIIRETEGQTELCRAWTGYRLMRLLLKI